MTATATTSRKLPAGWRQAGPGRAIFDETGTEVKKTTCGWAVYIPQRPGPKCPPTTVHAGADYFTTRAAAIEHAEGIEIPRTRALIAKRWEEALFALVGRPSSWPLGEANPEVVTTRRHAVAAASTPTGRTATADQLVVHIATGTPGRFHGTITYDRPVNGLAPGTYAGVSFGGDYPFPVPVHPDDVVVLTDDYLSCRRSHDDDHAHHLKADNPSCLIEMPDADLEGPALVETHEGCRYAAADGVTVYLNADNGTWWAHGPTLTGIGRDTICSWQKTLGRTYRTINQWRASRALQQQIINAYVKITGWRSPEVRLAEIRAQLDASVTGEDFEEAVRRIRTDTSSLLLPLESGTPATADDLEAAVHADGRENHTITIWGHVLEAWAKTNGRTPTIDGREIFSGDWSGNEQRLFFRDTGRAVDEPLPTHVIMHVITDRDAYAARRREQAVQQPHFRDEMLRLAAEITDGTIPARRLYDEHFRSLAEAERHTRFLRLNVDLPGLVHEVVAVADTSACQTCHHPVLLIEGAWRHFLNRFPIDCPGDLPGTATPADNGPGPDGPGPDVIRTRTPDPDSGPAPANNAGTRPGPGAAGPDATCRPDPDRSGPVAFGFTIQTLTDGTWRTVRTGHTPPTFRPDPDVLTAVAQTLLDNAGPMLGLGPFDRTPTVQVRTWHRPSGLVGSAHSADPLPRPF